MIFHLIISFEVFLFGMFTLDLTNELLFSQSLLSQVYEWERWNEIALLLMERAC